MIPDLGKYAAPVLTAYGVSITLYSGLIISVIRKNRMAKRALHLAETQSEAKSSNLA